MKREIIFRGKRLDNREWVQGYPFVSDTDNSAFILCGSCDSREDKFEVDPDTVGQFTGFSTKNGIKVFEDDIVVCENYHGLVNGVIVWFGSYFYLSCYNGFSDELLRNCRKFTVIGNKFDNPELLEVKSR